VLVENNGGPRWLSDDEQQAWRAALNLHKLLLRQLDRDLHADGLSGHDYEILVALSEAPDQRMRMTELADATSQSRSRLSHQITRMEARDLVRREECEGDKRGTWAVLTDFGMATIERVAPRHVESVRRHYLDHLSPTQQDQIRTAYQPIVEYLRKIRDRDLSRVQTHRPNPRPLPRAHARAAPMAPSGLLISGKSPWRAAPMAPLVRWDRG
jgi:DNA-binding MarR family transcriptional regulator